MAYKVNNLKTEQEEFLKEVLSIKSVNGVDSERNIAIFLRDYLRKCGVNAALQEIDGRHANVLAVLEGESEESIIWNGHLDTVPYGKMSEWNTNPEVLVKKNGCYYVRGASDMKSGLAAMVWTLGYMKKRGHVPKKTIYFLGTCDEEKGGLGARKILEQYILKNPSFMLIGEPTGLLLGTAQKGCIWLKLSVHGKTSHGAYPWEGVNALEYGYRIYQDLKSQIENKEHPVLGRPTVQMSIAKGGIVPNMTPDEAEFMLDIRVIPGQTAEWVRAMAEECIEKYHVQTSGTLKVDLSVENQRRAIEISDDNIWLRRLERELSYCELPKEHIGINYFTDASIITLEEPELPVLLFGPGEPNMAHKPNEYVELKKYWEYITILLKIF